MPTSRTITVPLVLATFLAGAFVGAACGRLPETQTEIKLKPVRKASASPVATPGPLPTLTHDRSPRPSPTPSPSPIGYTGRQVVVSGHVYDARGAALGGATIVARSLAADAPYEREVRTDAGSFVLNGVPEGVLVELVASKPGWTTRRRVAAFQGQSSLRHEVRFGASGGERNDGAAHFLAPYPEIVRTEPVADEEGVDPRRNAYKLVLSEPLGADDRRRFEAAVRLLPANDVANGSQDGSTTDLAALDDGFPLAVAVDGVAGVAPYAVRKGSAFRDDPDTRAAFTWSADGLEATLHFAAPLLAASDDDAAYQLALVSGGPDMRIRDEDGEQLGTDADGSHRTFPPRGDLILAAFLGDHLALRDLDGLDRGEEEAWAATHRHAVRFAMRRDETAPELLAVVAGPQGNDARIELRFSEPLAAYDGTSGGFVSPRLGDDADDLANYTFAVSTKTAKIADVALDGDDATEVDPRATATLTESGLRNRELRFAAGAFVTTRDGAAPGSVLLRLDPFDAHRVALLVIDRPDFFDPALSHLKARARIGDPAGNVPTDRAADRRTPVAAL